METRTATVIAVAGREAQVLLAPVSCIRCQEGRGCGAGLLASRRGRHATVGLDAGLAVAVGDTLIIPCEGSEVLRSSLLAFGLPLIGLLGSAAAAKLAGLGDGLALVLVLTSLVAAAAAGSRLSRRRVSRPRAIAVVPSPEGGPL